MVHQDLKHPGFEYGRIFQGIYFFAAGQRRILDGIGRIRAAFQDPERNTEHFLLPAFDQCDQRFAVSVLRLFDQRVFHVYQPLLSSLMLQHINQRT